MKTAKRFTSLVMALALVLALIPAFAAPAMAAGGISISQQPVSQIGRKQSGQQFTISVKASASGKALKYQWYAEYGDAYSRRAVGTNSPTLTIAVKDREFPLYGTTQLVHYRCEISTTDGSAKVTSAVSTVEAYLNPLQAFLHGVLVTPNAIINIPRIKLTDASFFTNLFNMFILPLISPLFSALMLFWLPIQAIPNLF